MNIITIDFDIIMKPSIEFYNNSVPRTNWEQIFSMNSIACNFPADYKIYQKLTKYLLNIIDELKQENVIFIKNHETLIKFLNPNEKYYVYNIDHHHDCGYNKENPKEEELSCANWVHHVPNLKGYTWIKDSNSNEIPEDKKVNNTNIQFIEQIDLEALPRPDKLIICYSPPWVMPSYWPLFCLWMDICNKQYNTFYQMHEVKS